LKFNLFKSDIHELITFLINDMSLTIKCEMQYNNATRRGF